MFYESTRAISLTEAVTAISFLQVSDSVWHRLQTCFCSAEEASARIHLLDIWRQAINQSQVKAGARESVCVWVCESVRVCAGVWVWACVWASVRAWESVWVCICACVRESVRTSECQVVLMPPTNFFAHPLLLLSSISWISEPWKGSNGS